MTTVEQWVTAGRPPVRHVRTYGPGEHATCWRCGADFDVWLDARHAIYPWSRCYPPPEPPVR